MTSQHITRCDKEFGTFSGWRFGITRFKQRLVRYFSDIEYGSSENALAEAESFREHIYTLLSQNPGNEADILRQLNTQYRRDRDLPAALRRYAPSTTQRKAITTRITPQLNQALEHYSSFMGLETSSVVRLALYHYFTHIAGLSERPTPEDLQKHVDELEAQAMAVGLPSFASLMTNETSTASYQSEYPSIEDQDLMAAEEQDS
jgi:hypothetical protein